MTVLAQIKLFLRYYTDRRHVGFNPVKVAIRPF